MPDALRAEGGAGCAVAPPLAWAAAGGCAGAASPQGSCRRLPLGLLRRLQELVEGLCRPSYGAPAAGPPSLSGLTAGPRCWQLVPGLGESRCHRRFPDQTAGRSASARCIFLCWWGSTLLVHTRTLLLVCVS